jgi:hypothetical protein
VSAELADPGLDSIARRLDYGNRVAGGRIVASASDGVTAWYTVETEAGEFRVTVERSWRASVDEAGDPVLRPDGGSRIDIGDMIAAVMDDEPGGVS